MTKRSPTSKAKRALKDLVYKSFPFMLAHKCGKPALYMAVPPEDGMILHAWQIIYPDGSMPGEDGEAICYSCKKPLTHADFHPDNIVRLQ